MTEDEKYWRESALDFIIGTGNFFHHPNIGDYRRETVLSFHKFALSDQTFLIRKIDSSAEIILICSQSEFVDTFTSTDFPGEKEQLENFNFYSNPKITSKFHPFYGSRSIIEIPMSEKNFEGGIYLAWKREFIVTEGFRLFITICINRIIEMVRLGVAYHSLEELSLKFNSVFNKVSQAIIFTDNKGKFAWLNPKAKEILEIKEANETVEPLIVAEKMKSLRERAENANEIMAEAFLLFSQPEKEIKNWLWKYAEQVFQVTSSPIGDQQIKGRLWLFEDISEIYFANRMLTWYNKQLEEVNLEIKDTVNHLSASYSLITAQNEEIVAKNDKLEKINQEKDDLIEIVSHDLKTPLAQIHGFLKLLERDKLKLDVSQKFSLDNIRNATNKGLALINEILDLSNIEKGDRDFTLQKFDLVSWIKPEIENHKILAVRKNILIESFFEVDVLPVNVNPFHLSRVMDNLISNAIKFSHRDTTIRILLQSKGKMAQLTIIDQGQGMNENDKRNLFKKFKKLSSVPTAGENSSGLGLYIVKILVESMQGQINCESEKGKGTTFEILLPVA